MKEWNRIGKIKAIILVLLSFLNLIMPVEVKLKLGILPTLLVPLLFGSIVIPLIAKFNSVLLRSEIVKPNWNDNPLSLSRPLSFFHFMAFFFLSIGLSIVIGGAIKFQFVSEVGLTSLAFGIGILIGINLALKWIVEK